MISRPIVEGAEPVSSSLVSVVIPCHNRGEKLLRAVRSVLSQTERRIELIVVDDASTENIPGMLATIKDPRLIVERLEKNSGAPTARNRGIAMARGRFVALLDSDDWWLPQKLAAQLKIALDQSASDSDWIIYNRIVVRTPEGEIPNPSRGFDPVHDDLAYYLIVERNYMQTSGLLGPSELFRRYPFDEALRRHQDFDLVLRMHANRVRLLYCEDKNVFYDDTTSDDRISKLHRPEQTLYWMRKSSFLSRRVRSELYVHYVGLIMVHKHWFSGLYYVALGLLLHPSKLLQLCAKIPSKLFS
jgi:glycosyltransferase involved in cell wall biosynthesis